MRDILITVIVLGLLPVSLVRPSVGILLFSWLSYMNPHRLAWGFAFDFPFAQIVAITTLAGLFFTRESKRFPWNATVIVWLLLLGWMCITTIFALNPDDAVLGFEKVAKIQIMALVTLYVMGTRERMHALIWVIAMSIAFFGVKGGVFGVLTGGGNRVFGPVGSFIEDNNSLGLAMIMTLPLLRFLQVTATSKLVKWGLLAVMALTVVATLATQSRGALLGLVAMVAFLWLKSRQKIVLGLVILVAAPVAFVMMPANWHQRMETIETYQQDGSAMGRITAWRFTYELANKRVTGGGFRGIETEDAYRTYAPDIYQEILENNGAFRAAHSIWFGMLGQHGWIGLSLFVLLGLMVWRDGSWVIKRTEGREEFGWHNNLARMLQVSLVGYASTGTFLSMEYFDYYYHVIALMVLLRTAVQSELRVPGFAPLQSSQPRVAAST